MQPIIWIIICIKGKKFIINIKLQLFDNRENIKTKQNTIFENELDMVVN